MAKLTFRKRRLVQLSRKERLFEDFFVNTVATSQRLESLFDLTGIQEQIFGRRVTVHDLDVVGPKERLRASRAWLLLSELYDYAVDGVSRVGSDESQADGESSLVIDGGEVIALLTGEESRPDDEWQQIVKMADGRVALAEGLPLDVERVALLASVDVRTVRNAISAGTLSCEDGRIACNDARAWLLGRKGFKPTVNGHHEAQTLPTINSAEDLGTLLVQCRLRRVRELIGDDALPSNPLGVQPPLDAYPGLCHDMLRELEAGVFRQPLNHAAALADFYGLPRGDFLRCLMRVFFPEQLAILAGQ